ncbi:histidine-rich glycoprotein-like [Anopheles maculipalpis]|uniref:histidine-rich glycoprotein-like n=1 Tax=Anopheles maculipalpis TaxID=1496333 RepID=UPI0021595A94|nr:histidine-rich glycoprotein-like [Anopheles maculipalpis]
MQTGAVVLFCGWLVVGLVCGAPRVQRSTDEAASSYFYFSRSPAHSIQLGTPFDELPVIPKQLDTAYFPTVHVHHDVESGESHNGKGLFESGEDEDDHAAYRVVEHDHEQEGGSSYDEDHRAKKGGKTETGYDKKHALDHASKGSYGKEDHKQQYGHGGDRKHSHHDEASHYNDHHAEAKRTKGGKHHEKKHHKKGSKTTGYHNVYHKDEYKKEHVFYDTSDHTGQFKKYGSSHEHHAKDAGQHAKGGHEDHAHQESSHKKAGSKQHGAYDQHHTAFQNGHGEEEHHHDASGYDHKGGHSGLGTRGYKIIHP